MSFRYVFSATCLSNSKYYVSRHHSLFHQRYFYRKHRGAMKWQRETGPGLGTRREFASGLLD